MSKLIGLAFAVLLLLPSANSAREKFAQYKAIEAYEIRPGILMMPRYSAGGQACEIGLEKLHYSTATISLDSSLSRKEVDQIFGELVPAKERGPRSKDFPRTLITQVGHGITTNTEYENVSIQIYSSASAVSGQGGITADDVVATIKWKNRKCQ